MNGYSPSSACGDGCLPRAGTTPRVGPVVRAVRLAALILSLPLGVMVALLQPIARGRLIRGWFRLVLRSAGVRLVVRGDATPSASIGTGTLVAANHESWLDIPAVLAVESLRVVAKTDVRRWPLIGLLAASGGTIFIDRRRLLRLPSTVAEVTASLRAGRSVLVFPEGSTWCGRTHGRFYPAAFQAAIDAGAPVRPVLLRYRLADGTATTAAAFVGEDTLLASVLRVVAVRGLAVEIDLAPLIRSSAGGVTAGGVAAGGITAGGIAAGGVGRARSEARRAMAARTAAVVRRTALVNDRGYVHLAAKRPETMRISKVVDQVE